MGTVNRLLDSKGRDVLSVSADTPVYDALKEMEDRAMGSSLILEDGKLVGIITERDCTRKVVLEDKDIHQMKVRDIMSTDLATILPDESLEECMRLITANRIRHLPVVDENGEVGGVVSIGDVVKYLVTEKEFVIKNLENYITGTGM
ncbi:CBS domain-containing protein [Kiritimatiella glycovorans]|uniref:Inosine-5'-monophosphate dehydrogenase n=1 Tax=Kiritimatiella glycovorans TaxID=1307763 RepID=A0A0G3ED87_9BACT|nr:CBS domain-containing protein [Kiritimatiella glycovorans]AKJ63317.1 Inosine-5'-monophosphate dehydrogenase [Kiritimatiella glycovorans]